VNVGINDTATAKLKAMAARTGDSTTMMTLFGNRMEKSVRRNFDQGGRPTWAALKGETVLPKGTRRGKNSSQRIQGKTRLGGPLVLSGDLRDSIGFHAEPTDLVLYSAPLEDPVKAAVHQWGVPDTAHGGSGKLAGKNHNVVIEPRPFLMFQPEDIDWFKKSLAGWIRVGQSAVRE
jgi:phage gpG-like protein